MLNVSKLAAMSAALRMLLSGTATTKPENVQIVASLGFPAADLARFVSLAQQGCNTLLLVFEDKAGTPTFRQIIVVDGTTDPREVYVGTCLPVLKPDRTFVLMSQKKNPQEIRFLDEGRVFSRTRATIKGSNPLLKQGKAALLAKAGSSEAMAEGFDILDHAQPTA